MPAPIAPAAPAAPPAPAAPAVKPAAPVVPSNGKAPPAAVKPTAPAPGAPGAPPEAPPPVEQKYKLKIDGEDVEMTQKEMERWASKGRFSDKVTQEAREAIKKAQALAKQHEEAIAAARERAKKDTDAWLKEHGIDPDAYAKSKLEKKVEEGRMTEDQRRARDLELENQRLKEAQEQAEKDREVEAQKALTAKLQKQVESELAGAMRRAGMTMGDEAFFTVYQSFQEMFDLGLLPNDGLLPHHADRIVEDAQERLATTQKNVRDNCLKLKGAPLLAFLGKEAVENVRQALLEEYRASRGISPPAAPAAPPAPPPTNRPSGYLSPREADEQLKKLGGRS